MNNKLREGKWWSGTAFKDLVVILITATLLFACASIFHAFERFAEFHQKYGIRPIDDIIIVFAVLAIAFNIFSLRRWRELQKALGNIRTLQGLVITCSFCGKARDDKGYWNKIEAYIEPHSETDLISTICPKCMEDLYGIIGP